MQKNSCKCGAGQDGESEHCLAPDDKLKDRRSYRYRLKLTKSGELKFISHLDWQNLILKSLRRAQVKLALSEGFNPMPKVMYSPALPIFIESECELVNFMTTEPLEENFKEIFQNCINKNVKVIDLQKIPTGEKRMESLDVLVQWAKYQAIPYKNEGIFNLENLRYTVNKVLSDDDLFIKKVNKKGIEKNINYRDSLRSLELTDNSVIFVLKTGQDDNIPSLRADELVKACFQDEKAFAIKRTHLFDKDLKVL